MKKNWVNTYTFEKNIRISDKSNITKFMIEHKMFPGNVLKCSVDMKPCNYGYNNHRALYVKVEVWGNGSKVDEMYLAQGLFCKVMSNIYQDGMSTPIN